MQPIKYVSATLQTANMIFLNNIAVSQAYFSVKSTFDKWLFQISNQYYLTKDAVDELTASDMSTLPLENSAQAEL